VEGIIWQESIIWRGVYHLEWWEGYHLEQESIIWRGRVSSRGACILWRGRISSVGISSE
jgi:hypothetical protein